MDYMVVRCSHCRKRTGATSIQKSRYCPNCEKNYPIITPNEFIAGRRGMVIEGHYRTLEELREAIARINTITFLSPHDRGVFRREG